MCSNDPDCIQLLIQHVNQTNSRLFEIYSSVSSLQSYLSTTANSATVLQWTVLCISGAVCSVYLAKLFRKWLAKRRAANPAHLVEVAEDANNLLADDGDQMS